MPPLGVVALMSMGFPATWHRPDTARRPSETTRQPAPAFSRARASARTLSKRFAVRSGSRSKTVPPERELQAANISASAMIQKRESACRDVALGQCSTTRMWLILCWSWLVNGFFQQVILFRRSHGLGAYRESSHQSWHRHRWLALRCRLVSSRRVPSRARAGARPGALANGTTMSK